jgi:hypothetical protein
MNQQATTREGFPEGRAAVGLSLLLLVVLFVNVPPLLCMGLDSDATQWDLCTRTVLHGGVLYRDAFENNLPGMLWLHAAVRSLLGWSTAALRAADLLLVATAVWLLGRQLPSSAGLAARAALAVVLFLFYFSTSEWCHCQRDTWMLPAALLALTLRQRQARRLTGPATAGRAVTLWGFVEGVLWGSAFWVKPFVAVPGLLCWLLSARRAPWRRLILDGLGCLLGGLTAAAAGVAWLWASGAWPSFVDVVFIWNREYVAARVTSGGWLPFFGFVFRLFPWVLVHLAAVPLALGQVWQYLRHAARTTAAPALLAAFYLGWLLQALCLQHPFDYVHVPSILLGLTVLARSCVAAGPVPGGRLGWAFLAVCVLFGYGPLLRDRLALWPRCVREVTSAEGVSAELHDRLRLLPKVSWTDLRRVRDYLHEQGVGDGEVTCFSMPTTPLYLGLGLRPSTRYFFLQNAVTLFRQRRERIKGELADSRQRFVVCDLLWYAMDVTDEDVRAADEGKGLNLPARWHTPCPWAERIVFRSGRYVVLELPAGEMSGWLEAVFGL